MTIQIEQVDLIMQRANVGYSEAKEALERCGGSTVEALVYLVKDKGTVLVSYSESQPPSPWFADLQTAPMTGPL